MKRGARYQIVDGRCADGVDQVGGELHEEDKKQDRDHDGRARR